MNHRLELSIKDAFKDTFFDRVDEMLLRIYYLYEKSPKKLRELQGVYDLIKETFEFDDLGLKPIRASGTRWLAHKINAINRILDKYGLYLTHLENVATDKSYSKEQNSKLKGYLKEWKTTKMLLHLCFYVDILSPLKKLSLVLQKEETDTVEAASSLQKAKRDLDRLCRRNVEEFPHIVALKSKLIGLGDDGKFTYQSIELKDFYRELEQLEIKKDRELELVMHAFVDRLEKKDSDHLDAVTQILDCEGWQR